MDIIYNKNINNVKIKSFYKSKIKKLYHNDYENNNININKNSN